MTIIQLTKLFIASLSKPDKLVPAAKLKKGKIFLYILFLSFISSIPALFQSYQILQDLNQDGQTIVDKIPEFNIKDGKFIPKGSAKSFTKTTNSIIFVFDPEGNYQDGEEQLEDRPIGIGLLKDGLYIANPSQPIQLTFQQLDGATDKLFDDILNSVKQMSGFILVFAFILLMISAILITLLYNLFYTIFANLVTVLTRRRITFGKIWNIVLFASTLPTLAFTLFNLLGLQIGFQMELTMLITVYLYYIAIRLVPKMES